MHTDNLLFEEKNIVIIYTFYFQLINGLQRGVESQVNNNTKFPTFVQYASDTKYIS